MKLLFITYNEALDNDVITLLAERGIGSWTRWIKVHGKGVASEPHLGSHVWPKNNNALAAVGDDDTVARAFAGLRELRQRFSKEGIKAFVLPVEDVT